MFESPKYLKDILSKGLSFSSILTVFTTLKVVFLWDYGQYDFCSKLKIVIGNFQNIFSL